MDPIILKTITFLYATVGIISLAAYWPTIKDLLKKKPSANLTSYGIWTATTGVAFLYGIFILQDFWYLVISGINFVVVAFIAFLSFRIRKK